MHTFALTNAATRQVGHASHGSPHPSQGASRGWSASTTQQYFTGNAGVQLSQSTNFASQIGANSSRQMSNWQSSDTSHLTAQSKNPSDLKDHFLQVLLSQPQYKLNQLQNENIPVRTTCVSQSAPIQSSHQTVANQSLHGTTLSNATYAQQNTSVLCKQPVSLNVAQTNRTTDASHLQQGWTQQTGTISSYTAAPSLPYNQMINANATLTAPVQNGHTLVAPNQIPRQSYSHVGYSQNYTSSCGMATSQSLRNNNVATWCTSSDAQAMYASNKGQINQQPSAQCNPSYYNCGGFRSVNSLNQHERNYSLMKTNERPSNHDSPLQQMLNQNLHAGSISKSFAGSSNPPPPYENHHYTAMSRIYNQNVQTPTVAQSESCSLKASQSLPRHSGQPLPQSVMSKAQLIVNASFQQGLLPNVLGVNTSGNGVGSGQVVPINETVTKGSPVDSMSNATRGCETVLLQRRKNQAVVVSQSNNIAMLSPFKQNDSCGSSISGHASRRAVAVVPPLSQEEHHSPVTAEPCKSVNDAEKINISTDVTLSSETTSVTEVSNQSPVTTNKAVSSDEVVLMISDSESKSLAQTSKQDNHESVEGVSDVSVSRTSSGKKTEGVTPQLLLVHELSLLPTKSWTAEHLTKLILEMDDKAKHKPRDTSGCSNIVKIVITMWNKNVAAMLKSYKETFSKDFFSEIEQFCDKHIKRDTSILTQVSPDFKDLLKRYIVVNDDEVYSEPPYKSLWLNVNDLLDEIDKEFGFPWALKRHLYVDEIKSPGHNFQTIEKVSEQAANEAVNKVLPLAKSESVDMTEESEASQNLPASTQKSKEKKSCESSYSFKIEVLPPEEAKVVFERVQQKNKHVSNCEKETSVSDSEQRGRSEDMDPTIIDPKLKKSSDNQLEEICCFARFLEMNSGLGKFSSECQCSDKQNANKDTIKILKPDPEWLLIGQKDVDCQTANLNGPKLSSNLNQIIDLTDDSDDQLFSFFDKEPEPMFQTCSQSNDGVSNHNEGELSADLSSPKEMHDLVFKERESERKQVQEQLASAGTGQSSDSVCCTQLTKLDPSNSTETKEPILLFNKKENFEQRPATSNDQAVSPSENKGQTHVSDATNQTSLSLNVNNERSGKKGKKQSSIDHYFPSLMKPKKRRLLVATDPDHTSEVQHSASKGKIVELVLFGAGQQQVGSPFKKENCLVSSSYEKHRPPGVLSVKLDSLGRDTTTASPTREYSVKQMIHEKWRRSIPTMSGSVALRHKNKLGRRTSLPALFSCRNTKEETQTIFPEPSDGTKKHILSLKNRRALTDCQRHEEIKRRRYSVAFEQPEHRKGSETSDEKRLHKSIVLKFSVLPNTFNLTDGSAWTKEASEPVSDRLEPVEKEFLQKAATKPKGTWYPSEAKQFEPLRVSKNVNLFHEYQKKYKEKIRTSTDE